MKLVVVFFKMVKRLYRYPVNVFENAFSMFLFKVNGALVGREFRSNGVPFVDVALGGSLTIGEGFRMNNGEKHNPIGRQQQCLFVVGKGAKISIGNNVGISSSAFISHKNIKIGNNVKIGGNSVIYDTDFHSLDYLKRRDKALDFLNKESQEVVIEDDVFIGAHTTILKGVKIGRNSIIGASSVVSKSIPPNQIWAGNPIKFIRKITNNEEKEEY